MRDDLGQDLGLMARLVESQLASAITAFFQKDVPLAEKTIERDDQVDNLLGRIEEKCFSRIPAGEGVEHVRGRQLRGLFRVALNLEKLGDYAVNIAEQAAHLARLPSAPFPFDLTTPSRVALEALGEVILSFTEGSADKARHACRCETVLDRQYREALAETFRRLSEPGQAPAFLITALFFAKFLERIGDSILNIGESTLFILTGERLKFHQYLHLQELVGPVGTPADGAPAPDFRQIWEGISGARIARLSWREGETLLWKEGAERKIEKEIGAMEEWNRIIPGLVRNVKARYQEEGRESFLGQYLEGTLLRDIYLTRPWEEKVAVTRRLLETVREIWVATAHQERPAVGYVRQIADRLPDLYAIHPALEGLRRGEIRIFGIRHSSLGELQEVLAAAEPRLAPPVSVRIHGDFNTNNIIYDRHQDRIHFIDVYRSGHGDYLQDIGVFLVSTMRTPLQERGLLIEMERLNRLVQDFALEFARLIGDEHIHPRLQLSRARSLITSARLITDAKFARNLYLQGVRLLERVAEAVA